MRRLLTFIVYTAVILLIGRNLSFLPRFYLFSTPELQKSAFLTKVKDDTKLAIKSAKGNYGIYYADLNHPEDRFGINDKEMFTAASVNKVPIVAVLYYLNNKGKISLDENITLTQEDIQAYGTGTLQYEEPGSIYSLKTLAKLALQKSDNTAAHILANRIGMDVIQKTINSWGLTQTEMENNKTSAYDMYVLFNKLYHTQITNAARTQELFGFMIDTDIEDRIPAQLPTDASAYHKTGDAIGSLHDVGIVKRGDTVFFLAVLTSDIGNDEKGTKKTISDLTTTILTDYQKKD